MYSGGANWALHPLICLGVNKPPPEIKFKKGGGESKGGKSAKMSLEVIGIINLREGGGGLILLKNVIP